MESLSNTTKYPLFNRVAISDNYMTSIVINLMERWGWERCATLYGTEPWAEGIYSKL